MRQRRLRRGVIGVDQLQQPAPLPACSPQVRIDEAGRVRRPGGASQLNRLIHGRVVRSTVRKEQLEKTQPQGGQDGRIEPARTAPGELADDAVHGSPPLDGSEGQVLGLSPVSPGEAGFSGLLPQNDVGESLVLEGAAQDGEGHPACRRHRRRFAAHSDPLPPTRVGG